MHSINHLTYEYCEVVAISLVSIHHVIDTKKKKGKEKTIFLLVMKLLGYTLITTFKYCISLKLERKKRTISTTKMKRVVEIQTFCIQSKVA